MSSGADPVIATESIAVALGSNLSEPESQVRRAFDALRSIPGTHEWHCSRVFRTAPWGIIEQPEFANAVAVSRCSLSPIQLWRHLRVIERSFGREAGGPRNGPRVIDLDLLVFGDRVFGTTDLIVPHPRATTRAFVLAPWLDVAPETTMPSGQALPELWASLADADRAGIRPW